MLHESYEVNVEQVLWAPVSVVPPGTTNSLVIIGRVAGGSLSVAGDIANRLFVHSVGFDPSNRNNPSNTANNLTNITTTIAGRYTAYAQQGRGTIGYATDVTSPGTEPPAFKVTASAGQNATTALSQITLTTTVENATGAVSYSWRTVGKSAAIIGPTTASPSVQFAEGFGDYIFEVTATDAAGNRSTSQVTVRYVGRF
jgi:hypothetical protein